MCNVGGAGNRTYSICVLPSPVPLSSSDSTLPSSFPYKDCSGGTDTKTCTKVGIKTGQGAGGGREHRRQICVVVSPCGYVLPRVTRRGTGTPTLVPSYSFSTTRGRNCPPTPTPSLRTRRRVRCPDSYFPSRFFGRRVIKGSMTECLFGQKLKTRIGRSPGSSRSGHLGPSRSVQ